MRGTALFAAIMILGIMVALVFGFGIRLNLFGGGEGAVHKTSLQSNIYSAGNALDAAKLYIKTSLDYSVYQACYDNLAKGGLSEITGDKGESGFAYIPDSSFSNEEFLKELESTVNTYLNRYADENYAFLYDYRVTIPKYSAVSIKEDQDTSELTVSTTSPDRMAITASSESGESITLRALADVSGQYDIPCLSLFLKGQELNPIINETFQAAFSNANSYIRDSAPITSCGDIKSCSDDLTDEFKKKLIRELESPYERGNYLITPEILDASVTVELIDNGKIIKYKATATQKVTINETELFAKYYPVWNGSEITFDNLKLVFINNASETTTLPPEGF